MSTTKQMRKQPKYKKQVKSVKPASKPLDIMRTGPPKKKTATTEEQSKALKIKYGTRGTDPRGKPQQQFSRSDSPAGMTSTIKRVAVLNTDAMINFSVGFVSLMTERGFALSISDPSAPYHLTQFIVNLLSAAARNERLPIKELPLSLKVICDALTPKTVRFKTGWINYTWSEFGIVNVPTLLPCVYGNLNLGIISGSKSNTYAYNLITNPTPYTEENGTIAWSEFLAFLRGCSNDAMSVIVASDYSTKFSKDASAFSYVYSEAGYDTSGAAGTTVEIFGNSIIRSPILSTFTTLFSSDSVSTESHIFANTPRFLGGRIPTFSSDGFVRSKFKPIFKTIDFDELFNALSYQVANALALATLNNSSQTVPPCPLAGVHVAMILRAAISSMTYHGFASDLAVTGFYPLQFPYCSNSTATSMKNWILPMFFAENIRALHVVATALNGVNNQVMTFIPLYGRTTGPIRSSYQFYFGENNSKVYADDPAAMYDVVDNSVIEYTVKQYLAIGGSELATSIDVWNSWITQLSHVMPQDVFSNEKANPALDVVLYTRMVKQSDPESVIPVAPEPVNRNVLRTLSRNPSLQEVSHTIPGKSTNAIAPIPFTFKSLKKVGAIAVRPEVPLGWEQVGILSNEPIEEPLYNLLNAWVLPVAYTFVNDASINRLSAEQYSPYLVRDMPTKNLNGTLEYPLVDDKLAAGGVAATKQATGEVNVLLRHLMDANTSGTGGVFSQMIADFAANKLQIPALSLIHI